MAKKKINMEVSAIQLDMCVSENCLDSLKDVLSEDLGRELTPAEFNSVAPVAVMAYGNDRGYFENPFWGSQDLSIASNVNIFSLQDILDGCITNEAYDKAVKTLLGCNKEVTLMEMETSVGSSFMLLPSNVV